MNNHIEERKYFAALTRHKRKQILKDKRSKRNRVNENGFEHNHHFSISNYETRNHIRTPLSDITSAVVNKGAHIFARKGVGTVNSQEKPLNVGVNQLVSSNIFKSKFLQHKQHASSPINQCTTPNFAYSHYYSPISADTISPK